VALTDPATVRIVKGRPALKYGVATTLIDICLKVNKPILKKMEDLIEGSRFILNMDATLDTYRIKPKNPES